MTESLRNGFSIAHPQKKEAGAALLSYGSPRNTIAAGGLNFCVRDGNRCGPAAFGAGNLQFLTVNSNHSRRFFYQKEPVFFKKTHGLLVRIS